MISASGTLDDLVPEAREAIERLLEAGAELGLQPRIISAGRTCQQQADIFAGGGGATHANLCRSWHVLGRAVDLQLAPNAYASYEKLGRVWEDMGGIWGGRWTGQFGPEGDRAHYEWAETAAVPTELCPTSVDLAECEALREAYYAREQGSAPRSRLAGAAIMLLGFGVFVYGWWRFRG